MQKVLTVFLQILRANWSMVCIFQLQLRGWCPRSSKKNAHTQAKRAIFAKKDRLIYLHTIFIPPLTSHSASTLSRYIPDTYPTHTRYICIFREYSTNIPRISHEYPKAPPKMIQSCTDPHFLDTQISAISGNICPLRYPSTALLHAAVAMLKCVDGLFIREICIKQTALKACKKNNVEQRNSYFL